MTRILVCGGRDFVDRKWLFEALDAEAKRAPITFVIHGCASGADAMAGEWATSRGIESEKYVAAWKSRGAAAGPERNARMLAAGRPDTVIAFPGGRGTADMVRRASTAGVPIVLPTKERRP